MIESEESLRILSKYMKYRISFPETGVVSFNKSNQKVYESNPLVLLDFEGFKKVEHYYF